MQLQTKSGVRGNEIIIKKSTLTTGFKPSSMLHSGLISPPEYNYPNKGSPFQTFSKLSSKNIGIKRSNITFTSSKGYIGINTDRYERNLGPLGKKYTASTVVYRDNTRNDRRSLSPTGLLSDDGTHMSVG